MSHYHHLSITERESIWESKLKGKSLREIARELGRSVSTISRELNRNRIRRGYRPSVAQEAYAQRRLRCRRHLILGKGELRDTVARLISAEQWSPEQISNRLALEHGEPVVSYATIYRALRCGYMEPKGTRRNKHGRYPMQKHLRRKGWRGRGSKGHTPLTHIQQTIEDRPKSAQNRTQFGHWEGDLVYSGFHRLYIVTLVERRSRYLLTGISKTKQPEEVAEVLTGMLRQLPKKKLRTVTLDRGMEFAQHSKITEKLPHVSFYFAHSHAPWERGTNENTNGLLRQYVPKRTYKVPFSPELLREFTEKLNRRPRKCLGWKSPSEVFSHKVLHLT